MIDSLFFGGFDPLHEVPELCTACASRPPVFSYDYHALGANGEMQKTSGFCCAACASELLKKLERAESQEWAEEEEALGKDDFDVTEFRKHRLATFPGGKRR
jgi:ferredoxin